MFKSIRGVRSLAAALLLVLLGAGTGQAAEDSGKLAGKARTFVDAAEKKLRPLEIEMGRAWWEAATTGKDAAYDRQREAQNKIDLVLSDRKAFADLKAIHDQIGQHGNDFDPLLARQVKLLYLRYLGKQVDPSLLQEVTKLSTQIEQAFNTYRAEIDGKKYTDNELNRILKESKDSAELKAAWEGSKGIGPKIEADLKELVRKRNQIARLLGFDNFHEMSLALDEHDSRELERLFDELDALTRDAFRRAKADIDARLAQSLEIRVEELRPWHYQNPFFQEPPAVYDTDLDALYEGKDLVELSRKFYASIGLPVDGLLEKSDLFAKEGKSPHAFCIDIDRQGDVRVLANIVADERWMSTMLHELGHAVYSSIYYPEDLPYFLRGPSHTLSTEGLAMMLERQTKVLPWMEQMGLAPRDEAAKQEIAEVARTMLRNKLLIFSRWAQVMFRFEKAMYEDPDQDLNTLWWDLVEKYQLVERPPGRDMPDYATKIHIVVAPVYYHNYALGELFASQVHHAMARRALKGASPHELSYYGDQRVGEFIRREVIAPGASLSWNELVRQITGEPLNPKAFAADMQAGR